MATERVEYVITLKDLFTSKIRAATSETQKLDGAINRAGKSASGFGLNLKNALVGIGAGLFAKSVVDTTAAMQGFENAIMAGSSSMQEGQKNIAFLNAEVDRLGIPLDAAFKGFKTFQGAVQGTSLDGEKARKIFTSVSQAATVMGLSADDTEGVFLAMGQMVSKGTVQAEELRGQLGERLPGAFRRAAEAMGMTTQELGKAMKNGEVMAEDLLPKLADQLGIAFDKDKLTRAVGGITANTNKMNAEFMRLKKSLGDELLPVIVGTLKALQSVFRFLSQHRGVIYGLVAAFVAYKAAAIGATVATSGLNAALLLNPYVAIAASVALLVAGIYELWNVQKQHKAWLEAKPERDLERNINSQRDGVRTMADALVKRGVPAQKAINTALEDEINFLKAHQSENADYQSKLKATLGLKEQFKAGTEGFGLLKTKDSGLSNTGITDGTTKSKTDGVGTNVDRISAVKPTNVYVNITKLVEQLNVQMQTIKDTPNKIKEEVAKALISAVNDVNLITA